MSDKIARVCDECGKADILNWHAESNGMVIFSGPTGSCFTLMVDVKKGASGRPTFSLSGKAWCPECLVNAIKKWIAENKK